MTAPLDPDAARPVHDRAAAGDKVPCTTCAAAGPAGCIYGNSGVEIDVVAGCERDEEVLRDCARSPRSEGPRTCSFDWSGIGSGRGRGRGRGRGGLGLLFIVCTRYARKSETSGVPLAVEHSKASHTHTHPHTGNLSPYSCQHRCPSDSGVVSRARLGAAQNVGARRETKMTRARQSAAARPRRADPV